uniref:Mitochondrial distribution and morphology protein 12 n=1 Tax=Lygus hesperus TaxID=30085 RepID=A0A0A9ZDY4_LYGHE
MVQSVGCVRNTIMNINSVQDILRFLTCNDDVVLWYPCSRCKHTCSSGGHGPPETANQCQQPMEERAGGSAPTTNGSTTNNAANGDAMYTHQQPVLQCEHTKSIFTQPYPQQELGQLQQ